MLKFTKVKDDVRLPVFNKLEFRRKNELIIQDLERQLRPCPFCHTSVELSCLTDDYFFPDLESGEYHPYISATFFIRCKRHCVEFRRHFDFKFKDDDDFSDYIGPVELVKEWNGE